MENQKKKYMENAMDNCGLWGFLGFRVDSLVGFGE